MSAFQSNRVYVCKQGTGKSQSHFPHVLRCTRKTAENDAELSWVVDNLTLGRNHSKHWASQPTTGKWTSLLILRESIFWKITSETVTEEFTVHTSALEWPQWEVLSDVRTNWANWVEAQTCGLPYERVIGKRIF